MQQQEVKTNRGINSIFYGIIMLIIIGIIIFLGYYIYLNAPRDAQQLDVITNPNFEEPVISEVSQFYPNMKFNHNNIGYFIDGTCSKEKEDRMLQAFQELSKEVPLLTFVPLSRNPDIEISCDESKEEKIDEKHFVAGEGGAKEIIQTGRYNVVTEGIILLYENKKIRTKKCDYPNVELHELLHVLGFDHTEDKRSIMYPFIESCSQIIDQSIIEQLNTIYSEENLPDLYFDNLEVVKKGRYLDFNLTIKNSGSIKSGEVKLSILDGDTVIQERDMGEVEFGAGVTLTTTNLKLKRLNPDQIQFIIDKDNIIKEIDETNNIGNIKLN